MVAMAKPIQRDDLQALSPLIVGGWHRLKSKLVAAWLDGMGNRANHPWALVLRVSKDALLYLKEIDLFGYGLCTKVMLGSRIV